MSGRGPQHQSWYLSSDGKRHGPYAGAEILRLAESGQLRADDLLWKPGLDGWKPLHAVAGLAAPPSDMIDAASPSPDGAVQTGSTTQPSPGAAPEASMPRELELDWKRAGAVAWLILWRSFVGGIVAAFAVGFVAGFILAFAGFEQLEIRAITTVLGWIAGLVVLVLVVQMALKKHYGDFRLALIPRDAP